MKVVRKPNRDRTPGQLEVDMSCGGRAKVDLPHQPQYSECRGFSR